MKVAKIITTSFIPREVRLKTRLAGTPMGFFSHSQNFTTKESIIELIKLNIELENKCNPGANVDLILVNNDNHYEEGKIFLNSLKNKKINNGIIKIINRENYGRSFGGYNEAYLKFKNTYDYYIFTEDDVIIAKNNYAKKAIELFNKIENCGFVSYLGISKKFKNYNIDNSLHVHGGMGLTSTKILNIIENKYGNLPYADKSISQNYESIIQNGEIAFTNIIHKSGFKLTEIENNIKYYIIAYDFMRNIEKPRYPNIKDKIEFYLKKNLYKYVSRFLK